MPTAHPWYPTDTADATSPVPDGIVQRRQRTRSVCNLQTRCGPIATELLVGRRLDTDRPTGSSFVTSDDAPNQDQIHEQALRFSAVLVGGIPYLHSVVWHGMSAALPSGAMKRSPTWFVAAAALIRLRPLTWRTADLGRYTVLA